MSSPATPLTPTTPLASSRGSTPAFYPAASPAPSSKSSSKAKAANVFSNDGSFLERFQRSKKEEELKKKAEEELQKKRNFDDRFKKRGKRTAPPPDSLTVATDDHPSKKSKTDKPQTQYEKEMSGYNTGTLKDLGTGVRPLVK